MKRLASQLTTFAAVFGLVFAPIYAQAKTRAADSSSYAQTGDDNDRASLLPLGEETVLRDQDWLLILFGTVATIGAIAIILTGQSSSNNSANGSSQSNGAT